jgi:hypothetical protein
MWNVSPRVRVALLALGSVIAALVMGGSGWGP